jgi:RNA-directed DNA polymerase
VWRSSASRPSSADSQCIRGDGWSSEADITRHTLVKGGASPDDPDLAEYWAQRRRKVKPPLDAYTVRLLPKQNGRCTLCGEDLLDLDQPPQSPEGLEWWLLWVTRKAIKVDYLVHYTAPNAPPGDRTHLVHASCSRTGKHARTANGDILLQPAS